MDKKIKKKQKKLSGDPFVAEFEKIIKIVNR